MATNSYTLSVGAGGYTALDLYVINEPPDGTATLRVNLDNVVHTAGGIVGQPFELSHLLPAATANATLRASFQPTSLLVRYNDEVTGLSMTTPHDSATLQQLFERQFPGKTLRSDLFPGYFSDTATTSNAGTVFDACSTAASLDTLREYLVALRWLNSAGEWLPKASNWEMGRVNILVTHSTATEEGIVTFPYVICYHYR